MNEMSLDQFLDDLRIVAQKMKVQCEYPHWSNIRLIGGDCDSYHCPITAVYEERHPLERGMRLASIKGQKLGLSLFLTEEIICAADNRHRHDPEIRHRLLEAVGIRRVVE